MAECAASEHEDAVMTDLEDGEDYNIDIGDSSSSQSHSTITLPPEVWANVIDCEYCIVCIYFTIYFRI